MCYHTYTCTHRNYDSTINCVSLWHLGKTCVHRINIWHQNYAKKVLGKNIPTSPVVSCVLIPSLLCQLDEWVLVKFFWTCEGGRGATCRMQSNQSLPFSKDVEENATRWTIYRGGAERTFKCCLLSVSPLWCLSHPTSTSFCVYLQVSFWSLFELGVIKVITLQNAASEVFFYWYNVPTLDVDATNGNIVFSC